MAVFLMCIAICMSAHISYAASGVDQVAKNTNISNVLLAQSTSTASQSSSAGLVPCGGRGQKPCNICDIFKLLQNLIKFVVTKGVPIIATLSFIYAGVLLIIGGADPKQIKQGQTIMSNVVTGLVIIFVAYTITNTILVSLAGSNKSKASSWYTIKCETEVYAPKK